MTEDQVRAAGMALSNDVIETCAVFCDGLAAAFLNDPRAPASISPVALTRTIAGLLRNLKSHDVDSTPRSVHEHVH